MMCPEKSVCCRHKGWQGVLVQEKGLQGCLGLSQKVTREWIGMNQSNPTTKGKNKRDKTGK